MSYLTPKTDGRGPGPQGGAESTAQGRLGAHSAGREEELAVTAGPPEDPLLPMPLAVSSTSVILSGKDFSSVSEGPVSTEQGRGRDDRAVSLAPLACGESCWEVQGSSDTGPCQHRRCRGV